MPSVQTVLIVGGGTVGSALTLLLRRHGIDVDLLDLDPGWNALGSGITLQGNALHVLRAAGVWGEVKNNIVAAPPHLDFIKTGGPELPGACGMYRPTLHKILTDAVRRSGTQIRLGATVEKLEDTGDSVTATLSDGTVGQYDLVVGADGIHSTVRSMIDITATPTPTGLAIWRAYTPRPAGLEYGELTHGENFYISGYTPVSTTHLYAYVIEDARERSELQTLDWAAEFGRLTESSEGFWPAIRASVTDASQLDYRGLDHLLVNPPWNLGRVIIIGDAAHACPPTLAQGAAMGLEDALVLAELLAESDVLDQSVFDAFHARRYPRVRDVVQTSVEMCDVARDPERAPTSMALLYNAMTKLTEPA